MDIRAKIINNSYINDTQLKLINNECYWKIYYNEEIITKHSKYTITYICLTCNNKHSFNTTQLIRKINKCSIYCYLCRNESNNNNNNNLSLHERKNKSEIEFNLLDDEFNLGIIIIYIYYVYNIFNKINNQILLNKYFN